MSVRVVISGCGGKMGSRIAALALSGDDPPISIAGAIETPGHPSVGQDVGTLVGARAIGVRVTDDVDTALRAGDVLIEFTAPEATLAHLARAQALKKPMVIGTTGIAEDGRDLIARCSRDVPIVFSPNMSVGVNVLFELAKTAAERLGPGFSVEIEEAHHKGKKDAPSGTAKRLQELLAAVRSKWPLPKEIPCRSIREGDIVGDHKVMFSGHSERLELSHHAVSRDVFALGALKAAAFVAGRKPGLYDMSHVLNG
jgi:4-hydroxy-tetrahydrodipicolinate reductase